MTSLYRNLKAGDKFKIPGLDNLYVRTRIGFVRLEGEHMVGTTLQPGDGLTPLKSLSDNVMPLLGDDWSKVLDSIGERRKQEQQALNEKLGEPAVFIADAEDPRFGVGYWKGDGGVFSYRKYVNGYDPMSRHEYTNEFIELLNKVKGV